MRRRLLVGAIVICVALCGAGAWAVQSVAVSAFVLPGAADVLVTRRPDGALRIAYHRAGEPFAWRGELGRQLQAAGWRGRSYTNGGATRPPFLTTWFTRELRLGPLSLEERAILGNHPDDPNAVSVDVYRAVHVGL